MEIDEFIKRYDAALVAAGLSNRKATEMAGVKEDTTRNPRRKGTSPDVLSVIQLAHVLGVPPFHFLEPLGITPDILSSAEVEENSLHNDEELTLLRIWRKLDEPKRRSWLLLLDQSASDSSDAA
ncbi:hypothetical protein AA21952_3097 [Acetobacter oeni LMG 21952]|nr:hypothetical protein AA21952_3097 [Acetobacter oeni LMG 21952]